MAPKKNKGKGKEIAREKDNRFVNEQARQRYESLQSIPFIYERGFIMEKRGWSVSYAAQIQALGWESLCHPRTEAVLPWVYEFYSNAKYSEGDSVLVRGRMVNFSAQTINDMFDLRRDVLNPYKGVQSLVSPEEMAAAVCGQLQPVWAQKFKKALKSTCLSREAKVWCLFINASLLPTRHLNMASFDRVALIYAIIKGKAFDVGVLIHDSIRHQIREDKVKHLWFPTLITELCKLAGVEIKEGDLITPVGHHITETVIGVNIKVGESSSPYKKTSTDTVAGKYIRPPPKSPEAVDLAEGDATSADQILMRDMELVKAYQRHQHVYFDARLDYICNVQAQLMHKAKLPMPTPDYRYSGNFDKRGFLMTTDRERLDLGVYDEQDSDDAINTDEEEARYGAKNDDDGAEDDDGGEDDDGEDD